MQNKGFVKVFAVLLTLVCLFYMSFSFVSSSHMSSAKEDPMGQQHYLDSMSNEKVWLGYTLKECQELEIGLGLDLKGGMSVFFPNISSSIKSFNTFSCYNTTNRNA